MKRLKRELVVKIGVMKNSLLLNNFIHERPKTAKNGQIHGPASRQSSNFDLPTSRISTDNQSPRDNSSSLALRLKAKLLNDSGRNSVSSEISDSDDDVSISDLEDNSVSNRYENKFNDYWANLDDSIKKINDDSDKLALKPRPNFKSSNQFKDVMQEMSGNTEYGVSKGYTILKEKISRLTDATSITALALSQAAKTVDVENENDTSNSEDEIQEAIDKETKERELVSSVGGAKRAWRVLKSHVKETGVEHRTSSVKMNWEALRHHVSGITDIDRARRDLYERYGFLPTIQEDGTKVCRNVMWLNRTRAQIIQNQSDKILKGSKLRAQSARPFTVQSYERNRNLSGNSLNTRQKRPVSCYPTIDVTNEKLSPSSEKLIRNRSRPTSVKPNKIS